MRLGRALAAGFRWCSVVALLAGCGDWHSPLAGGAPEEEPSAGGAFGVEGGRGGDGGGENGDAGAIEPQGGDGAGTAASGGAGGKGGKGGTQGGQTGATGGTGNVGSGGDAGAPGPDASGGSAGGTATGGSGNAGSAGAGGSAGTGGTPVEPTRECEFEVNATLSPVIGTVGILEWSVDLVELESARIEFGLDEAYGMTAPVSLAEPYLRTLLLGMKASRDYHYRIVAEGGGDTCVSADAMLTTGPIANGLPRITLATPGRAALAPGFIVSSFLMSGPAFILDADGDYVWWYGTGEIGRAQMSFDGQSMWYADVNVRGGRGSMHRVSMDGQIEEALPEFGDNHHDFTVLPDGSIGFIVHEGSCDAIMEWAPDGSVHRVIGVQEAHGGDTPCHTNSIHYHPEDDTYTFSDLHQNAYVKVTRAGHVEWVLGGTTSTFTGDGASWTRQHGHHLFSPDRLLFYNNGKTSEHSLAVEVQLDLENMIATRVWAYDGGLQSLIYGDVQRLGNGNTLVTYSTSSALKEVTSDGELVQSVTWALGGAVGYSVKRATLYGPPPLH